MDEFIAIIANISWRDWVDILIVGLLFYGLFLLLRQTRSAEALRGLMAVLLISFFLFFAASAMQFSATALIFRSFWIVGVLVFLIVFQQDFRRALISVGRMPVFRVSTQERKQSVLEVVSAAQRLAEKKSARSSVSSARPRSKCSPIPESPSIRKSPPNCCGPSSPPIRRCMTAR